MKKIELIFGGLLVPLDYCMLVLAAISAYFLRFQKPLTGLQPVLYTVPFETFLKMVGLVAVFWLVIFALAGLYHIRGTRRLVEEFKKIFLACATGVLLIVIIFFFQRDFFSSRFIILAAFGFALVYVTIARFIVIYIERFLFKKGIGVHNVVLIGDAHTNNVIANELGQKKSLGLKVKLKFLNFDHKAQKAIEAYLSKTTLDELIQTNPNMDKEESLRLYEFCDERHIVYKYAAALFDTQSVNISVQPIAGVPIIEVKPTPLDGWGKIVKRCFDIFGSLILLILSSPFMLLTAILIFFDSGRPIFYYRNEDQKKTARIGQYGRPFFYFKFRSMVPNQHYKRYKELAAQNTRKDSPLVKIENDPRITRVGKIIRRFSFDELPEFFLVFKGTMSLVGPRPHLPEEVARYKRHHKRVLNMKPGVTGLAQISGRSDLDFEDEVRLDTFYMENWSLWLDIVILIKTPFILFKRRKAL